MKTTRTVFLALLLLSGCSQRTAPPEQAAAPKATPVFSVDPATAATITGVIRFDGAAPKREKIDMSQDPGCTVGSSPNFSEGYVTKAGKLANVFVYIKEGLEGKTFAVPSAAVGLDQNGCRYVPHVLGVMAGQKLHITNSDSAMHNVHPKPVNNESWNVSQMPKSEPIERSFPKPELMLKIMCNQHPWMRAYVSVTTHPFFAVSKDDGSFEIKGLPPGEYTLAAVHERMGEKTIKIRVGPKESAAAEFKYAQSDVK